MTEQNTQVAGIPGAAMRSLERVPIRVRENAVTISAWQMTVGCDAGSGTITLVEGSGKPVYRGDGVFLGWSQEQLATAYKTLNVPPNEPPFELHQLG